MSTLYDLIIIGSGPAGLSAAIYAKRAELNAIVIEKEMVSGGQVLTTYEVDNYPGLPGINGFDLGVSFRNHAEKLGASFVNDQVLAVNNISLSDSENLLNAAELTDISSKKDINIYFIHCEHNDYYAKSVIIATGAHHTKLSVPGEERLTGMGVSYCATCDGAFFKNKVTAVVGGGDVALEDAIFLSRICSKVYLIHRRDELRGAKSLQNKIFAAPNIEVIWDSVVDEITGSDHVETANITNKKTGVRTSLAIDGIFIAVGIEPESSIFSDLLATERGYIIAGEDTKTSVPGIFAAGDVRTKSLRQIITAAADGANAVTAVEAFIANL